MDDLRMPLSEDTKTPQVYKLEIRESNHDGVQPPFPSKSDGNEIKASETVRLIGLTKNELEKYCNDPFWKVVRYAMFVLFWVAWILMFLTAVLLIVFSPKCAVVKEPEWWRKQVSYQIFTPSFRDSNDDGIGDFNGIREKLHDLRKIGIRTIWVTPIITIQKDDFIPFDVIDFTSVDERFGTMDDLKLLIDATHELNMHFTMDLPISTTSVSHKWFKSAKTGDDYVDYYVWERALNVKDDPNYIAEEGKENAYLAYDGKDPILNWRNPAVRESMFEVAKRFLDIGVDGFHIDRIGQLIKHLSKSEGHVALSMIDGFIGSLREYASSTEIPNSREIVVFTSLNDFAKLEGSDSSGLSNFTYVIDDSITVLNNGSCPNGIAQCLHSTLIRSFEWFNTTQLPHAWQFTDYHVSRLSTRFDKATAALLTFVQLSLPGIVELYYGQELSLEDSTGPTNKFTGLMQWNSSEYGGFTAGSQKPFFSTTLNYKEDNFQVQYSSHRSSLKTLKAVAKMHQRDHNFALGETQLAPLTRDVILFGRFHQSDNGTNGAAYLIGANFGTSDAEINGKAVLPNNYIAAKAEIAIVTANVDKYLPRDKILMLDKIVLGPKQGIIIKVQ
ncbi:alpha amylase [Loa loa]|uniref:alpha-glucosidase n=1 Tax=Loa loa TaxID=7209 RepID=A0A1I7V5H0_LOALO|nr:alpha amylase [Loa loa]EFO21378.1 alpha amylase [Loa loa]